MGVLAYLPLPKNRKIGFGHATAQNRAHISTVEEEHFYNLYKITEFYDWNSIHLDLPNNILELKIIFINT